MINITIHIIAQLKRINTINKLDSGKSETTPVDLSKLNDVVKNEVVKKDVYNELVKKVTAIQTTDTSNLVS